jgi:GNAT superfamily N-acetyltransferase
MPERVTYQVESWATYAPDARPLWPQHWAEIALDHETIALDPDDARYEALDAAGVLHIVTMRTDPAGRLVGYWLGIVQTHLHYKSTLHAVLDVFWVHPAYRQGWAGVQLFRFVAHTLKARGVVKVVQGCKMHKDVSMIFERLGYTEIERVWSKLL